MTEIENEAGAPIRMWADPAEVEEQALAQVRRIASLPWVAHVAVMPDVHYGMGATVGSVIGMRGAVSPAAVGVDIGCGMAAVQTSVIASDLPESLRPLRLSIEERVPVGFRAHDEPAIGGEDHGAQRLMERYRDLSAPVADIEGRAARQIGTLGGGNHFIEVCIDERDKVWLMLHSGSRNIGKTLADYHIRIAKKLDHNDAIEDRDLAVFLAGTEEMAAYRRDLYWAQEYAMQNRRKMLDLVKAAVVEHIPHCAFSEPILCHHNYVAEEEHYGEELMVTRKGAIRANRGDWGIIPGSMGTGSYIVRGLGSPESLASASHGAGRRMSRKKAKKQYTEADLAQQTEGVECRKDAGVVDEIPGAYKDIGQVMAQQSDLVEVVAKLRQVVCVKG